MRIMKQRKDGALDYEESVAVNKACDVTDLSKYVVRVNQTITGYARGRIPRQRCRRYGVACKVGIDVHFPKT
jgi:hypothetical protein